MKCSIDFSSFGGASNTTNVNGNFVKIGGNCR